MTPAIGRPARWASVRYQPPLPPTPGPGRGPPPPPVPQVDDPGRLRLELAPRSPQPLPSGQRRDLVPVDGGRGRPRGDLDHDGTDRRSGRRDTVDDGREDLGRIAGSAGPQ